MESKMSIAVLGFFGLFAIVQGLSPEPEKLAKYKKCWIQATCLSNGKANQNIVECINILRPEELQALYQNIQDYYHFKSSNIYDVIKEFCKMDDAKKPDVYDKALNGIDAYKKKVCADGSKKGECTRIIMSLKCDLRQLDQLRQQGKCQIDA